MKRIVLTLAVAACAATAVYAGDEGENSYLNYFLPGDAQSHTYNPNVPTPEQCLGYKVCERFVEWSDVLSYMQALSEASPRVSIKQFGTSYEHRRFIQVAITSQKNQARLEEIRQQHLALTDASVSEGLDIASMPLVVNIGAGIHGNEASGVNAILPVAYYFAASEDANVKEFLENTVLILTPGLNPDGINRFATWVNVNSSMNPSNDPNARVHSEMTPSSRANHYWNDCNRDALNLQHPEGRNGVEMYLYWMPNVLLDLHEQGSYKRGWYYFSPGDPNRTHAYISQENQDLTKAISKATKAAFDSLQVKCFTERGYDDFYIGKFAAYGDVQGSVCLLHEETGTYGHYRDFGEAGYRDFAFTVRNQSVASVTLALRSYALKDTLMSYMRDFYIRTAKAASEDAKAGYIFDARGDRGTEYSFLKMLDGHQIEVYPVEGKKGTYAVPFNQKGYWKIKCIFEDITSYQDSVFYDVSTWTLPRAFNLNYETVDKMPKLSARVVAPKLAEGAIEGGVSEIGYSFDLKEYFSPKFMTAIQRKGVRIVVTADGKLFIPTEGQKVSSKELYEILSQAAEITGVNLCGVKNAKLFAKATEVRQQNTAILVNTKASGGYQKQGQIWKLLDDTYDMNHNIVNLERLQSDKCDLNRYSSIVCYGIMPKDNEESYKKVRDWVDNGGTLILYSTASNFAKLLGYPAIKYNKSKNNEFSGVIFAADLLNLKNPLLWGYDQKSIDIFKLRGDSFVLPEDASVVVKYSKNAYRSGCASEDEKAAFEGKPVVATMKAGKGRIVFITEDLHFRAVWYGTSHILTNAIFFGDKL